VEFKLGNTRIVLIFKDIGVLLPESPLHRFGAIKRDRLFLGEIKRSQIVQSGGVVLVFVGKEHRIDPGYPGSEQLFPHIRPCVD